jgi:hypothetical protein
MKLPILIVLFTLLCVNARSQNGTLPDAVSQAFAQKFPKAKMVKWNPEDVGEFSAIFVNDSVEATALFEDTGKWINTWTAENIQKLPQSLVAAVKEKHPKSKINKAGKVEHWKKGRYYELELKTKNAVETFYFDSDGKEVR